MVIVVVIVVDIVVAFVVVVKVVVFIVVIIEAVVVADAVVVVKMVVQSWPSLSMMYMRIFIQHIAEPVLPKFYAIQVRQITAGLPTVSMKGLTDLLNLHLSNLYF